MGRMPETYLRALEDELIRAKTEHHASEIREQIRMVWLRLGLDPVERRPSTPPAAKRKAAPRKK
jgi:hypothetical protein